MQAAEALGVSPARLLKTLMAKAGGAIVCVLVPSDAEVSLKKLAAAAGAKDAAMLPPPKPNASPAITSAASRHSARRSACALFIAQSALAHDTIIVNGGRRGLQIELTPADLVRVLDASAVDVGA